MAIAPRLSRIPIAGKVNLTDKIPLPAHIESKPGRDEHRSNGKRRGSDPMGAPSGKRRIDERCQRDDSAEGEGHGQVLYVGTADDRVDR